MLWVPAAMGRLTLEEKLSDRVEFSWSNTESDLEYDVLLDNGLEGYLLLDTVTDNKFIAMTGNNAQGTYRFKVRARNVCGYIESDELIVTYASVPGQMPVIQTISEACDIKVRWTLPDNGDEEITQILI
jgi:hypothetical protein